MNKGKLLCRENYDKASNHLYRNETCLNQATEEQFNIILNEAFLNQATEEEFNQVMKQSLKFLYGVGDN